MKLVLNKINNLDNFFNAVNRCDDKVNVELPGGGSIDINSGFGQYVFDRDIFHDASIHEVELTAKDEDDAEWLNRLYGSSNRRSGFGFLGMF